MNVEDAVRDLTKALCAGSAPQARLRAARRVLASRMAALLDQGEPAPLSVPDAIRLALHAPSRPAQRACAVLLVHALATPGLVPPAAAADTCALVEGALRDALSRSGYPFAGATEARIAVLERLHLRLGELLEPLQPTFPNWIQGLHAG